MNLEITIDKIKSGDTAAFTGLVRKYQNLAVAYAFSILKDFHRAQDAVQEAFIVAYYHISQLQDPESFPGWLKGIVRNHCHRQLRGKMKRWDSLDTVEEMTEDRPSPDQELIRKEQNLIVLETVQSLPERQREVISLFYIEENSQQDVAAFLEMSVSDVNNCLHAARKTLKRRMDSMVDKTLKAKALSKDFAENIGKIIKVQGRLVDIEMDPAFNPVLFDDFKTGKKSESKLTIVQRLKNGQVRCLTQSEKSTLKPEVKIQAEKTKSFPRLDEDAIKDVVLGIGTMMADKADIFQTGIKVIDLLCPFPKNGNIGLMGNTGTGRSALIAEMYRKFAKGEGRTSIFFFVGPDEASSVSSMIEHEPDLGADEDGPLQTTWLITARAADSNFAESADYLDARPFFCESLAEQKRFPAVDPIHSRSRMLDVSIVGEDHFRIATQVRNLLANEKKLDALQASRARKLRNFFTQPFFVMENASKVPGVSVELKDTIEGCRKILAGEMDALPEKAFLYVGGLGEIMKSV